MLKKIIVFFIFLMLLSNQFAFCVSEDVYEDEEEITVWSEGDSSLNSELVNTEPKKDNVSSPNNPLKITSGSAILIEQNSGKVIYDYNMHEKFRPASVTKIMTILLIMEALDSGRISLTDKVICTEDAAAMRWFTNLA